MTSNNYGVPPELLDELAQAESAAAHLRKRVNEEACKNLGVKPGDVMQNKFTGLRYQVKGFNAYVNNGCVRISVDAYRYYQTGRRAGRTAYSSSFISFEDLECITDER